MNCCGSRHCCRWFSIVYGIKWDKLSFERQSTSVTFGMINFDNVSRLVQSNGDALSTEFDPMEIDKIKLCQKRDFEDIVNENVIQRHSLLYCSNEREAIA